MSNEEAHRRRLAMGAKETKACCTLAIDVVLIARARSYLLPALAMYLNDISSRCFCCVRRVVANA